MQPSKRRLLLALASGLGAPVVCTAQSGRKPHIGYLSPGTVPRYDNAFLEGLQEQHLLLPGEIARYDDPSWRALIQRGRFDGKRVRIDIRASAKDYPTSATELARDLVRQGVDVLYGLLLNDPELEGTSGVARGNCPRAVPSRLSA
jgi:hypothetical protein